MKYKLTDPVSILKGVGEKRFIVLKSSGIATFSDLLYYFPRKYLDRSITKNIIFKDGEIITIIANVVDQYLAHGRKSRLIVGIKTQNGERISLVFFQGVQYFKNRFKEGQTIVATGKLEYYRGMQIVHPDVEILSGDSDEEDLIHTGKIIPLYPSNETLKKENLDSRGFRRLIKQILDFIRDGNLVLPEILPAGIVKKRTLTGRRDSMMQIHFPEGDEALSEAKRRFAYEELYFYSLLILYKKTEREKVKRILWPVAKSPSAEKVLAGLPYKLTDDQKKCVSELLKLSSGETPMAALLQGDVGSGKTVTALLHALKYTDNDIQVAIVAPTEILARQHYITFTSLLSHTPFSGIELFVGKEKEKQKREKLDRLKNGEAKIAIGTHTLFQEDVKFRDLGLVVIDEQHKFGVEQRESIRAKGKNPDIIAMTATPIPRTLCLTLYGDLQLLVIKSKPAGRKPIVTKWFTESKRPAIYSSVRKYLSQGRQCYIIYPLIEESEKVDLESCIKAYERLKKEEFTEFKVGLLHGRMKTEEKDLVMSQFKKNEIQILVTTTVVEVGIDVPNASVLLIENSERFGISQLHQLRGRVGRGEHESFCIFVTPEHVSSDAKIRLEALVDNSDGFILSEIDLKLRGPGELLGLRQSGLPDFKIADLQRDGNILHEAMQDALEFGNLKEIEKSEIRERFEEGRILFPN